MVNLRFSVRFIILFFLLLLVSATSAAQTVTVRGVVRDSLSRKPIPFASVLLKGTDRGVLTDEKGRYSITSALPFDSVMASSLGYSTRTVPSKKGSKIKLDIDLVSTGVMLGEVIAKPKRQHYTKKNNPAVAFMEKIRATSDLNDPRRNPHYNYDKYERITSPSISVRSLIARKNM